MNTAILLVFLVHPVPSNVFVHARKPAPILAPVRFVGRHKLFFGLLGAYSASVVLDVRSTEAVFRRCSTCREGNWHFFGGHRPSAAQLYATDAIISAPIQVLNWYAIKTWDSEESFFGRGAAIASTSIWASYHLTGWRHNVHVCPAAKGQSIGAC